MKNNEGKVHCTLVMGKARVVPIKPITMPRLELTAALLSVKVSTLLKNEFEYGDMTNVFWIDSQVVLGYINRFLVYVANSVQQIRNQTEPAQWHYVNTGDNPANNAFRGISP